MTNYPDRHEIGQTGVKGVLRFELQEMLAAFEEAFDDLTDEQAWAFPFPGGFNVAWCVMHVIENHNWYLVESQGGARLLPQDWDHRRWNWQSPDPTPEEAFPSVSWMKSLAVSIRQSALHQLDAAAERDLDAKRVPDAEETSQASYLRMLEHTHVHIRWIWQIRGGLGLAKRAIQR